MRKLILTSFKTREKGDDGNTGFYEKEHRIVVIDSSRDSTSDEDREQAGEVMRRYLQRVMPHREIGEIIPHETIQDLGEPTPEPKPTLVYVIVEFDRDNEISKIHAAYLSLEEAKKAHSEMTFDEDEGFGEVLSVPLK